MGSDAIKVEVIVLNAYILLIVKKVRFNWLDVRIVAVAFSKMGMNKYV